MLLQNFERNTEKLHAVNEHYNFLIKLLFPLASCSTSDSIFLLLQLELILNVLTAKLVEVGVKLHIWQSLKVNTWIELGLPAFGSVQLTSSQK